MNRLITVLNNLPSGTSVTITKKWCQQHGIIATSDEVKQWGKTIAQNPSAYGLKPNIINPGAGIFENKSSNNLAHYIKI